MLELRYPVRLEHFGVRADSGGDGYYRGGNGAVRKLRALESMAATVVGSRRVVAPFGIEGGKGRAPGFQWVERASGRGEILGRTDQAELAAGDVIVIETPGGGGFGEANGKHAAGAG